MNRCPMVALATLICTGWLHPANQWISTYVSTGTDMPHSVQAASDGGFIIAGVSNYGEGWIVKLAATGEIQWQRIYGGKKSDGFSCIRQTPDSGYVAVGWAQSSGGDSGDGWVMKINAAGKSLWQKTCGGKDWDRWLSCDVLSDGGLIAAGTTLSYGAGLGDFWLVRLDSTGNVLWQKAYGSTEGEEVRAVHQTSDGGFVAVGQKGSDEFLVIRVDGAGNPKWSKTFSHSDYFEIFAADLLPDGGLIAAGSIGVASSSDGWLAKLDANGKIVWQKRYGGKYGEKFLGVRATPDGGCVAVGETYSWSSGLKDAWLVRVNSKGNQTWEKRAGGLQHDVALDATPTPEGGYLVAAHTRSHTFSTEDWMILKLSPSGDVGSSCGFLSSTTLSRYNSTIKSSSPAPHLVVPSAAVKKVKFPSRPSAVVPEYLCESEN